MGTATYLHRLTLLKVVEIYPTTRSLFTDETTNPQIAQPSSSRPNYG